VPVHVSTAQSTCVVALLDAVSWRAAGSAPLLVNTARESRVAPAVEVESAPHRPAVAEHVPDALVVRVAAFAPAVIVPWVAVLPEPVQPAVSAQSTSTVAVLVAVVSPPSGVQPSVASPPAVEVLPAVELLSARHSPPVVVQVAEPSVF
jgi:hypothetical protein